MAVVLKNKANIDYGETLKKITQVALTKLDLEDINIELVISNSIKNEFVNYVSSFYICKGLNKIDDGYSLRLDSSNTFILYAQVICHELLHIKQIEDKKLIVHDSGFYWNLKQYPSGMHQLDRPWEQEIINSDKNLAVKVLNGVWPGKAKIHKKNFISMESDYKN